MIVYLKIDMRLPSSKTTKDQQHPSLHEMMHQSIKSIHELTIGIRREKTNCMSFFFIDSLGLTQSMTQIGCMQLNEQSSSKPLLSHQSSFASSIFSSGSDSCDSRSSLQIKNRRIKKGGFQFEKLCSKKTFLIIEVGRIDPSLYQKDCVS